MRVVALYDIHGNLPALEAVLADAGTPDAFVIGGDVASGPLPAETLDRLLALPGTVRWVRGNADRELLEAGGLSERHRTLLESFEPTVELDGVLYCHGTPRSDTEIVTSLTPAEPVEALLGDARLVVAGHTHRQFRRGRWVNAGSVGLPYEGRPGAFWLEVVDGEPRFRETAYDIAAVPAHELLRESLIEPADPDEVERYFEGQAR